MELFYKRNTHKMGLMDRMLRLSKVAISLSSNVKLLKPFLHKSPT